MAIVLVAVTVIAILAVVLAMPELVPKAGPGCIYAIIPGVMGAEPVDACGRQAEFVCAEHTHQHRARNPETIRKACRDAEIVVTPAAAKQAQNATGFPHQHMGELVL